MKKALPTSKLITLLLVLFSCVNNSSAAIEPVPTGSFIINMGVTPQTYANGLKPWGLVYELIHSYKVQVKWIISQSKVKDGIDFTYNGIDYKGGTFIISKKYRTAAIDARIAYWQTQGVVGVTTSSDISLDVSYTLKYTPRWTFDFQNGSIALNYLDQAGIPSAEYPKKYPSQLTNCDDIFVMPHADPTWATHQNLYYWNQSSRGWLWDGCHATSVMESLVNPLDATQQMNFLSQQGLVMYNNHQNGTPPYSYRYPNDPEMQFMGTVDAALQNGSEQVFLPLLNSSWRPTTHVAVYDPSQQNIPSLSPGEAGIILYGRAFGDNSRGKVMYEAGHNMAAGNADAVAAIRAFFNFSFLSVYDKEIIPTITGPVNAISGGTYSYSVTLPAGYNAGDYYYHWTSACGGTFSNPFGTTTTFTPGATNACGCTLMVTVTDGCGREYYQTLDLANVCAIPPVALDRTSPMILNPPGTGPKQIFSQVPMAGTDVDGYVINYVIKTLPSNGVLSYDNDNNPATPDVQINSLPSGELVLTNAQMKSLKFDPVDLFGGNATFLYTVTDNSGLRDLTPATYTIPVNPPPIARTFICTPVYTNSPMTPVCPMSATDNGTIVSYTILTLPPSTQCVIYLYGVPCTAGQVLTPAQSTQLTFKASGSYVGYSEITYTATDNNGASDPLNATITLQLVNQPPVATDVSSATITNPVGSIQYSIPALAAADPDGSVVSYTVTNAPPVSQGILYYNNGTAYVPVTDNKLLTIAQAGSLKFDPTDTYFGVAKFKFTATDNGGLTDQSPATYSIPVRSIVPVSDNINNPGIYTGAGLTTLHPLSGHDPDSTNIITAYMITELPPSAQGTLYYNNGTTYVPVIANTFLTPYQGTTLKFAPSAPYIGNVVFRYTVRDDEMDVDPTPAIFTIPVVNQPPSVSNVNSWSVIDTSGIATIKPLTGTDPDGTITAFIIMSLPAPSSGILSLAGIPVVPGQYITPAQAGSLQFDPVLHNDQDATFKYTAMDNFGAIDASYGNYTIPISFVEYKKAPHSPDVINPSLNMKAVSNQILPLVGEDSDGVIAMYQIKHATNNAEGQVFLQGIPVSDNQFIPASVVANLTFLPTGSFKGNSTFKFKSIDNDGLESSGGDAQFTIPVLNAKPVAQNISINTVKKGTITSIQGMAALDSDGTVASYKILTLPTLGTLQYDSTGTGVYANAIANKVLTPVQASSLRINASNTLGTTSFTYTAKDNMGDTSSIATYSIPIGSGSANQAPVAMNITSNPISVNATTQSSVLPFNGSDVDGNVASYILVKLPPSFYGIIYYDSSGTYAPLQGGQFSLTLAQASTLKFLPSGNFVGNVSLTYSAVDNNGAISNQPATYTIPVINSAPVATSITNASIASNAGPTLLTALSASDSGSVVNYIITQLPDTSTGALILDGSTIQLNQVIPAMYANRVEFNPNPSFSGNTTFKFSATDAQGSVDQTPATYTIPVTNQLPVAYDVRSQVITNALGTGQVSIPALRGLDIDGTIASYIIKTMPTGGVLYKHGTAVTSIPAGGLVLNPGDAGSLMFDPTDNYSGNGSFTYTVKDNSGNISANTATYTIPMNLPPLTSNVTAGMRVPGSVNASIPALVGSDDVAVAFFSILTLPSASEGVLYLNNVQVTSLAQVDTLTILQAGQLSFAPAINFDGVIFTFTATDNMGVIDVTPAVYTIPYTAGVLPVELSSFTGTKQGDDNLLSWTTLQEDNLDHFEIGHSTDGVNFNAIGNIRANGNTPGRSDYSFADVKPMPGAIYYRLKIVDRDLRVTYSNIVLLKRDITGFSIDKVLPNPFVDKILVSVVVDCDQDITLSLHDLAGKVLSAKQHSAIRGVNTFVINDLESLSHGMYIVEAKNEYGRLTCRVIK